jgi:hypothetical protein
MEDKQIKVEDYKIFEESKKLLDEAAHEDHRRFGRTHLDIQLDLKEITPDGPGEPIEASLRDVSKGGVGLISREPIMIGSVLEARLSLDGQSVECCLKVVRSRWREDGSYFYGCIFVGLTENKADQIAIFQIFNDAQYEKRAEEEAK